MNNIHSPSRIRGLARIDVLTCPRHSTMVGLPFSFYLQGTPMPDHSHRFIEDFDGFIGFGLNRESDMDAITYYLQKFSDDQLMALLRKRLTNEECQAIFDLLSGLLRKHLTEPEYHRYFLKDHSNQ
ncbi:hypothetical protein [uncultured Desulfosarcina sp.]|uniref:hypothetical protein n=1 Tax=uncultured Desulfosarcina sp. TaxID=218289 RepID=UPI0029C76672|nr:hypothetical protein [uncultured Desulfosarcina sp.]